MRNNCDVTNLSPRHHEVANVLHITRGKRRNHDFYTSHLPFRGQYFAEQKSMSQPKSCLTTRSSPCYFGVFVVPISYLSHDIFFKERVDFLETLPFATSKCILARRPGSLLLTLMPSLSAVTEERGKLRQCIRLRALSLVGGVKRRYTNAKFPVTHSE